MNEEPMDDLTRLLREEYNAPPPTPRDEMWASIQAGLRKGDARVVSLDAARVRRGLMKRRTFGWASAAAAVLVVGFGLGRFTAPGTLADAPAALRSPDRQVMRLAAADHLERTETLLRMVRADGTSGQIDPAVGKWAEGLLTQTRLFLDATEGDDPAMRELLEDLELVLVQIVGVADAGYRDEERTREELSLALKGIEENNVLGRIQAVTPAGSVLAGT
ncbi:MAG TPA: hypothetical protein VLA36_12595 [Longimicrobiales bacterium]|nr:hypothetical protein [Longimicrobiales bacterium]